MRRIVDWERAPTPIGEIGFNNPKLYVFRTAYWLQEFGVLPKPGGLDVQEKAWVEDMENFFHAKDLARADFDEEREMLDSIHKEMNGR